MTTKFKTATGIVSLAMILLLCACATTKDNGKQGLIPLSRQSVPDRPRRGRGSG